MFLCCEFRFSNYLSHSFNFFLPNPSILTYDICNITLQAEIDRRKGMGVMLFQVEASLDDLVHTTHPNSKYAHFI